VMLYGESGHDGGAKGWLVGEPHKGLQAMFIMMNAARLTVGMEGLATSERATQQAVQYARERIQGKHHSGKGASLPIIEHPDVRRMLMRMKSQTEAMRAMATLIAASLDLARHEPDAAQRAQHQALLELLTPIFKGWATETGVEVASLGMQVHGGMGFVEETGAAQHLRDARISPIYEGTTGIQANDFISRKLMRDQGACFLSWLNSLNGPVDSLRGCGLGAQAAHLDAAVHALRESIGHVVGRYNTHTPEVLAVSVPLLMQCGYVLGGLLMACQAAKAQEMLQAGEGQASFLKAKISTVRFYLEQVLPGALAMHHTVMHGGTGCMELATDDQFPPA
jgi:3-(methylthio)propanoyl-CoA dehydrogenase